MPVSSHFVESRTYGTQREVKKKMYKGSFGRGVAYFEGTNRMSHKFEVRETVFKMY